MGPVLTKSAFSETGFGILITMEAEAGKVLILTGVMKTLQYPAARLSQGVGKDAD
jgi:hypothetical protein